MTCDITARQLAPMLYGELSFEDEELVHNHLDRCPQCRSALKQLRTLHLAADRCEIEVPASLMDDCRRQLRITVAQQPPVAEPRPPLFKRLSNLLAGPAPLAWRLATVAALLTVGFFAGHNSVPVSSSYTPVSTRVRYVQPDNDGGVQIVLEEVRQRTLEGGLNDNRIRTLLVAAAREANDPGVRVETVDLLKSSSGASEVRRALLAALQQDPNPGVRLKALEALRPAAGDPETRRVLARVLLNDDNPGIRTHAVDLLVQQREPALVGVLQELVAREQNSYVRLKCQRALSDMNASVETF
ncbi:MAG TPA: HEAT repeat domain-containing protein [Bryobacteraceae bacterium]|nr:HEAT repeat domain-containing protein [Bryobacteraceae bacterium]